MTPALLQATELNFNLGGPGDLDRFPWSVPASILLLLLIAALLWKGRRNYMALPELRKVDGPPSLDATVVIPARNEERRIEDCVRSFPRTKVIVADDASKDRTAELARQAGAEVIAAPPLPKGSKGKPNALAAAAASLSTPYVLFADADTRYEPGFLASAVEHAAAGKFVMLTPLLRMECVSFFERMLAPYAYAIYFCGVNTKRAHNVLQRDILASGHCILFQREAYEFVGGHRNVATAVLDDVAITQAVKRHRMKLRIVRAEGLGSVRLDNSTRVFWRAMKRNSARVFRARARVRLPVIFCTIFMTALPAAAAWSAYEKQWGMMAALFAVPWLLLMPWYRGMFSALLYLPAMLLFPLIALNALTASFFGRKTSWKGRKV
ncbi:MAG: glycosyltransferase [Candidatus Solibacter usitatus]|nr:glycosyltransferase [Candidatus Solibacter usitatus]